MGGEPGVPSEEQTRGEKKPWTEETGISGRAHDQAECLLIRCPNIVTSSQVRLRRAARERTALMPSSEIPMAWSASSPAPCGMFTDRVSQHRHIVVARERTALLPSSKTTMPGRLTRQLLAECLLIRRRNTVTSSQAPDSSDMLPARNAGWVSWYGDPCVGSNPNSCMMRGGMGRQTTSVFVMVVVAVRRD
ncbi:unnamed protein product [Toxocara canis]|uniref:Uncharacterized protein n=1 Tax=Toxocara canis TaxID=6265 RepID=A0A183URL4_TOXCA|nr:unnamed protein product [Toxocara canis]